jgi:predicted MPP superfamily phosphohydrolase
MREDSSTRGRRAGRSALGPLRFRDMPRVALFGVLMLLLGALSHFSLWRWAAHAFPWAARHRRRTLGLAIALSLLAPLARALAAIAKADWAGSLLALAMTEYLIVLFAALPLTLLRAASAGGAWIAKRTRRSRGESPAPREPAFAPEKAEVAPPTMTRRQVVEATLGTALLGSMGTGLGWGAVRGRHAFVIDEVAVRIPGLPRVLDGYVIGQISDIHVGPLVRERELAEGLDRLKEARADLVVLTGDILDFDPSHIPLAARALGAVRARDGVFAVLGNHDQYTGAAAVAAGLRGAGIDVLENEGRVIRGGDGGGFALLGVEDLSAVRFRGTGPDLGAATRGLPRERPRILLSHQPSTFDLFAGHVALQLSGHTHGGQVNPGFRPADLVMRYVAGRYEKDGSTLWVNRGFGVVGPPARIGAPPEVTRIVLVAA